MRYIDKIGAVVVLLGAVVATSAVAAAPADKQAKNQNRGALFSYNYAQLSFVDLDAGYDGFKIEGSFDLNPELALTTSYMSTDNSRNRDYDLFTLGLAYHQRLVDIQRSDLVLHGEFQRASMEYVRNNSTVYSDDETGLRFGAMLRHQAQKNIEVFGDLSYSSLYDNDLALTGGVNLALNQQFSVVAAVELSDNDMLLLGLRLQLK